ETFIRGDPPERAMAKPKQLERFGNGFMTFLRGIGHEFAADASDTFATDIPVCRRVARHGQRDDGAHRSAAYKDTAGLLRESESLLAPLHDSALDVDSSVIASATIGVHRSGEHFRQDAGESARTVNPAEKARMHVAGGIRQNQLFEVQ